MSSRSIPHFAAFAADRHRRLCGRLGHAPSRAAFSTHSAGCCLPIGAITYLAMPRIIFETYMADQRLPISLAFMVIACAHLNLRHDYVRRGFATVLVLLLAIRVFEVQSVWSDLSATTTSFRELRAATSTAAPRCLLPMRTRTRRRREGPRPRACGLLAIIERSALVTTAFTVVGKQILHVREDYRDRVDTEDGTPPTSHSLCRSPSSRPHEDARRGYWEQAGPPTTTISTCCSPTSEYENPGPPRSHAGLCRRALRPVRINLDPRPGSTPSAHGGQPAETATPLPRSCRLAPAAP